MENYSKDVLAHSDLQLDNPIKMRLAESAKWSKFIAIVLFIFAFIILIAGVFGGGVLLAAFKRSESSMGNLANLGSAAIMIIFFVLASALGVMAYFLYNFSIKIKVAIDTDDPAIITEAFAALKIFFIISAVFTLLSLLNSILTLF